MKNKITVKFVLFQILFSFLSLILIWLTAWDFSKLSIGDLAQGVIHNVSEGVYALVIFSIPIVASVLCNLTHLHNLNRLKNSEQAAIEMIVITALSILVLPILFIVVKIGDLFEHNWLLPLIIMIVNICMFIPQIMLIESRDKKLPELKEKIKAQRNLRKRLCNKF